MQGRERHEKSDIFFYFVVFLLGLVFGGVNAKAADYPERAIEILVPFGAGGGSDTAARAVVEGMKPLLKNGVLVNNMPGGGATKGMLYVSQQPADGYSVLAVTTSHLIDAVKPKTRANILRDFDPLCRIQWDTSAVTISGDSQFKTLADLVEWGKKNPKGLKFAGTSPGGWLEIQTVAFFKMCGVDVTFVPFDSGAEIKAAILGLVLGDRVELSLRRSLLISGGDPMVLVSSPSSVVILLLAAFSVIYPVVKKSIAFRES